MKLYDVPRNTRIKWQGEELMFKHIDGMYSYCESKDGNIWHVPAWEEVEVLKKEKQDALE